MQGLFIYDYENKDFMQLQEINNYGYIKIATSNITTQKS